MQLADRSVGPTCQVALEDCSPNDNVLASAVQDRLIALTRIPKLAVTLALACAVATHQSCLLAVLPDG